MKQTSVDALNRWGGPAGTVCACLFARAGRGIFVLERNWDFEWELRGELLHPCFREAMPDAGPLEHIAPMPGASGVF